MTKRTTCIYDGDTYSGTFVEDGRGSETVVTVRYSGRERARALGTATAAAAASHLLAQLVREKLSGRDESAALH